MKRNFLYCIAATLLLVGFTPAPHAQAVEQARFWFVYPSSGAIGPYSDLYELTVRVDIYTLFARPLPPTAVRFVGWSVDGARLRATFLADKSNSGSMTPAFFNPYVFSLALPPLAPGAYTVELGTADGKVTDTQSLAVVGAPATLPATSLSNRRSGKFFLTASSTEVNSLLALTASSDPPLEDGGVRWGIAEQTMNVWSATGDAPPAAKPVCRLYHPQAVTHFYSANAADCALVRKTSPWIDEGIAFKALTPSNGACPTGTDAVYRLFSAALGNHVYTRSTATVSAFGQTGWANEGVVFCSPKG